MGAGAIAGIALSAITTGVGLIQSKKAKDAAAKMKKPSITNPYANLDISTVGADFQGQQALRSTATQTAALSQAGGRGMSFIPQVSQQGALTSQQIAANLDMQRKERDRLIASGEQYKEQAEMGLYQQEMGGLAAQYSAGQQNAMGGLQMAGGLLASGFSEGGAFNRPQQQNQMQPTFQSFQSFQPQPLALQPLTFKGF